MIKGPANKSIAHYTYDSRNRLISVLNQTYEYDAENNRIASTDSQTGKTIRYIHNTNSSLSQLLIETDGSTTTKYVYGNELISAKTYEKSLEELKQEGEGENKGSSNQQADTTYYYHYDNLKSTTLLTDETGKVVETYDYSTYGEITRGNTTLTRFLYNGGLGVSNDGNGIYYMRARYYNPEIKRFINQDVEVGSMDNSTSLNRYAYVQGNPVNLTDPFGLSPEMLTNDYGRSALNSLYKMADAAIDFIPVVGTARDIQRAYQAYKKGNTAEGIKNSVSAILSLGGPVAKGLSQAGRIIKKAAKTAKVLKAEKSISKTAQITSEGLKLAGNTSRAKKLVTKAGNVSKKIARTVKNGVSSVARTVKKNVAKVYKSERKNRNIESGNKTGTVWDNITPTQENYPYTNIPKSFEIEVNGEKMWVHGNATEHMYEDVYKGITTGNGTAYTNPNLYTQEIMSDFYGSLQEATKSGIVYGEKITQGNWEFIFAQPRQEGQLPVIKHAQFNGWH